jgi:hypothetical protein
MPRPRLARLVYRKQDTTLALVTRAEARTVGAAIVGRRRVNVKGQRHMFVYLHPNQRASLRRQARGSVVTDLVVDGRRVRAYPTMTGPADVVDEEEDEKEYIKNIHEEILEYLNRSDNLTESFKNRAARFRLLGMPEEAKRLDTLINLWNRGDGHVRKGLTEFTSLGLEERNALVDMVIELDTRKEEAAGEEGFSDFAREKSRRVDNYEDLII